MDRDAALRDLGEALSSYESYRDYVAAGLLLVNADDDSEMVIEAAVINVERAVNDCLAAGLTRSELAAHFGIAADSDGSAT